ncbi:MAG: bis(5'-nucleosyl)-tetraphosphatase (symmetrical) YqeK [Halanaerobiales bacterium]
MQEAEIIEILKNRLQNKRFEHTLDVADTAEEVVRYIYQQKDKLREESIFKNESKDFIIGRVRQAALLHDLAKNMGTAELYNIADIIIKEWEIDEQELAIPQVLHAPVSAYLAKHELGVADYDVLEAIRFHTIGDPAMGEIAQVIFVADFIEPNRDFLQAQKARYEFHENGLEAAIIMICDFNIKYNIDWRREIHPNTILLRNAYLRRQT